MTAPQIPERARREDARAFAELVGLDPRSVRALEIVLDGIWATIFATDAEGRRIAVGEDAACHRIFIPFDAEVS
ncbi:hypothetical protein [Streptomyces sp. NPDC058108]|uniref:hypothetical protein n=1 Tax=Streptomyces sp. NPDC058108 TaxID=3346344 RepID=UPI0036E7E86C